MKYKTIESVCLSEPIPYRIIKQGGSMADCVVALANDRQRLIGRIMELEAIAPKRIRTPDGVYVWHCPNELIPET